VNAADLFEAYIAGMYLDKGLEVTQEYLSQLLEPYALAAYRTVRYQHGLHDDTDTVNDRHDDAFTAPGGSHSGAHSPGDNQGENVTSNHTETATLHQYAEALGKSLEYTFRSLPSVNSTPWWESTVMADDSILATARGTTKKAAKNYAAGLGIEEIKKVRWVRWRTVPFGIVHLFRLEM
jgi:ribonuclease III